MESDPAKRTWETAKGSLQVQVTRANYETWLKDTVGVSYLRDRFVVGTPSAFAKEWLEKRLHSLIKKTLIDIVGHDIDLSFEVVASSAPSLPHHRRVEPSRDTLQASLPLHRINPRYTFGRFIVGECNRLAFSASLSAAEDPGGQYNPLYIYGDTGLGKSHLAHAIGNAARDDGLRVACASGEQFTCAFVSAIKEKTIDQFRDKFGLVDLLIIEDFQFVLGKSQTLASLFHIFDEFLNDNRQVVITGNQSPYALQPLQAELRSRLESGLVAKLRVPDFDTRVAIVLAKAAEHGATIDRASCEFIARQCPANIRKLEGAIKRVLAYSRLTQKELSPELAREALHTVAHDIAPAPTLTPDSILNAVCNHFKTSPDRLRGKSRDADTTLARRIAIYLVRQNTGCSLQDVGKLLGGRDHSTVLRNYQKVASEAASDAATKRHIQEILRSLSH